MSALRNGLPMLLMAPAPASSAIDMRTTELDQIRERHNVPAFTISMIDRGGEMATAARGLADRASGRPAMPDMLWRIGSITRTFNALAFLMLAEEGRGSTSMPRLARWHRVRRSTTPGPGATRCASCTRRSILRDCSILSATSSRSGWTPERTVFNTVIGKDHRPLVPVTERHCRRSGQTAATIAFVPHDGALYLQGDFGSYWRVPAAETGVSSGAVAGIRDRAGED